MDFLQKNRFPTRFLQLTGLVLLLALFGYGSFIFYPQVRRPSTPGSGLVFLAAAAGLGSLFSPCSFPILMTVLAREVESQSKKGMIRMAVAFTLGVTAFLLLLGAALAAGKGVFISQLSFTSSTGRLLRAAVGVVLISLSVAPIRGRSLNFAWLTRLLNPLWQTQYRWRQKGLWGHGFYGFGYILAGFG